MDQSTLPIADHLVLPTTDAGYHRLLRTTDTPIPAIPIPVMGVSPGHVQCYTWGAHRMHLGSL